MCDSGGCEKVSEKENIDFDKHSLEKGGFSFLDRPDIEEHAKYIKENKHRSLERGLSDGFSHIGQDIEISSGSPSKRHHNESFDSVTEAVLLDDGIIRQCSLSQQVCVDGETWLTEEFSEKVEAQSAQSNARSVGKNEKRTKDSKAISIKPSDTWTPVLLLVPVRLGGGEKLNPIYGECVRAILASDNCVGIIGK